MDGRRQPEPRSTRRNRAVAVGLPAAAALLVAAAAPAFGQAAEPGEEPGRGARTDSTRAERPPPAPPADWVDVVLFPLRVATLPFDLIGEGIEAGADLVGGSGPTPAPILVLRDLEAWGLNPGVGSVGPRSGPGAKLHLDRFAPFHLRTALSVRGYQRHEAWVELPDRAPRVTAGATFRRWAEPHFWGVGPDTRTEAAVDYRWDQWSAKAAGRPLDGGPLDVELSAGLEANAVGAGSDGGTPDVTERYAPGELVGLGDDVDFVRFGGTVTLDLTSRPVLQQRGIELSAGSTLFRGISGTASDFHRVRIGGAGYLPFNPFQMLALSGRAELNRVDGGPGVPFTHLASLGDRLGSRAYPDGRFRGNDLAVVSAEYRWELWRETGSEQRLEAYLFYERGVVARKLSEVGSGDWRPSYGFGMRTVAPDGPRVGAFLAEGDEGLRLQLHAEVEP